MNISRQTAQDIINEVSGILGQQLNFFGEDGYILASTNRRRIGTHHAGAEKLVREGLVELIVYRDDEYPGAKRGCNFPLVMDTAVVGAIGITGPYEEVYKYGQIIKKMTEILLRDNDAQQRRKIEGRIRSRFLDDWLMTEQSVTDPAFLQRARAQDIDVTLVRRVATMRIAQIERYSDSARGQELIDEVNRMVRGMLGEIPGAIFSKTASVMICLLPDRDNAAMRRFLQGLFQAVESRHGLALIAGVDSRADAGNVSMHYAFQKAMKALSACAASNESQALFYDDITYELFLEEISGASKALFVSRVFKDMDDKEIDEYTELLSTLYEMNGSIGKTAQAHFIHKNTLQYKLNKLARRTGYNPRDYSAIPLYYLAVLFRRG